MRVRCARVVRRNLWIFLLLALFCVPNALAQDNAPTLLMPGVTYTKRVQFTPHGPVVLNVVTAPKPGGLYSLAPVLTNGEPRMCAAGIIAAICSSAVPFVASKMPAPGQIDSMPSSSVIPSASA